MTVLDFTQLHGLCAHIANAAINPTDAFGPNIDGYRTTIVGGYVRDSDFAAILIQVQNTIVAAGQKASIVTAWKRENGQW